MCIRDRLGIGSNSFIDGFEEGLIGANVGDEVDLNLTFPDTYKNNPDLAGKPVVFHVTVNSIGQQVPMTYENMTDEYVAGNFSGMGFSSVQGLKDGIKANMVSYYDYYAQSNTRTAIIDKLGEICADVYKRQAAR